MATENYKWHGMKKLLAVLALMVPAGGLVHANDPPEPTTISGMMNNVPVIYWTFTDRPPVAKLTTMAFAPESFN